MVGMVGMNNLKYDFYGPYIPIRVRIYKPGKCTRRMNINFQVKPKRRSTICIFP